MRSGSDTGDGSEGAATTAIERPGARDAERDPGRVTEVETSARGGRHTAGGTPGTGAASTTSPAEALWREELASTGTFVVVIFAAAVVLIAALPWLGGHPIAKRVFAAGLVIALGAGFWLRRLLRDSERYAGFRATMCWGLCVSGALTGVYYFGAFSPVPAVLCLGIHFVSAGQSRASAWLAYGLCAVFQAALAALILTGSAVDRGLLPFGGYLALRDAFIVQVLVQVAMLSAFALGRGSRRARLSALTELEQARQRAAERAGMLEEVREDLDRALRLGEAGRFTEREVGSYRLGPVIGRGAMGDVYEASHAESGAPAAVKLIQPERADRSESLVRFLRELQIAASLDAPNVVRVLEISEPDAPLPYLAMERLVGENLAHHLRSRGRLEIAEAIDLAHQVGAGIDAAARAGIVHRDLKPQNLFLHAPAGAPPAWKILDFGVSKLADGGDTLTRGRLVGTPAYMAPEQAQGRSIDSRADVYALGAVVYRTLTGHRPFRGRDVAETVYAVVYTMPPRPSDLADVPSTVDAVLAVALAKEPSARFDTAAEFADAFARAARGDLDPELIPKASALARTQPWGSPRSSR